MRALRVPSIHPRSIYWAGCNLLGGGVCQWIILIFRKRLQARLSFQVPIFAFADNDEWFCSAKMWHLTAWFCHFMCETDMQCSCSDSGNVTWHWPWKIRKDAFEASGSSVLYGYLKKLRVVGTSSYTISTQFSIQHGRYQQLYLYKGGQTSPSWNLCVGSTLEWIQNTMHALHLFHQAFSIWVWGIFPHYFPSLTEKTDYY